MAENTKPTETVAVTIAEGNDKTVSENMITDKVIQVKTFAGLVSIITFVLSLPILASVIWLLYMKDYDCEKLLMLPKLQDGIGIGMIFVFLISNVVVFLRSRFPILGFFTIMVPLIVVLTVGLALVGADKFESRKIMATPMWFKEKVRDNSNWKNIKSCIYDTGACDDLVLRSLSITSYDFSVKKFSSIESGCCKPPAICEMAYVNATFWTRNGVMDEFHSHDGDCDIWKNNQTILCYDCESCREGFVKTMESKWWKLGLFLILMALLLIVSHMLLFIAAMWERYNG